jgi:hypothetical protein
MPQPQKPQEPISTDFLQAAVRPKAKARGSLLGDMAWALQNDSEGIAKTIGQFIPNIIGGIGGQISSAAQIAANYGGAIANKMAGTTAVTPIKLPGSNYPAPATVADNSDNLIDLITLGAKSHGDRYKQEQRMKASFRKDANGNPLMLEDSVELELNAAMHGFGEIIGINPLRRSLSGNYPEGTDSGSRFQEGVMGGLGVLGTIMTVAGGLRGKAPGVAITEKQLAEVEIGAKKVVTVNDMAMDLGVESGDVILQAAKENKSLRDVVIEKHAQAAQPVVEMLAPQVDGATQVPAKPMLIGADAAIAGLKEGIQNSSIVGQRIVNAAGHVLKTIDGNEFIVDAIDPSSPLSQRMQSLMLDEGMIDTPTIRTMRQQVMQSDMLETLIKANPEMQDSHLFGAAIASGALDAAFVSDIAELVGLTPEVANKTLANYYIHSASQAGSKLNAFNVGRQSYPLLLEMKKYFSSQGVKSIIDRILGDRNADFLHDQAQINGLLEEGGSSIVQVDLKKAGKAVKKATSNPAASFLSNISKISTQMMLSSIPTPTRNFVNTMFTSGVAATETGWVDAMRNVAGRVMGAQGVTSDVVQRRGVLANVTFDMAQAMVGNNELRAGVEAVLDALPGQSKYLRGSASQMMGHLAEMQAVGNGALDAGFKNVSKVLQAVNTLGELPMRRAVWGSRMIKNLDYVKGFGEITKSFPELADPIRRLEFIEDWASNPAELARQYNIKPETMAVLDNEMRLAVSDAQLHTLKSQMSFQTPLVKEVLDIYHRIPFADVIGPAFPKMLFNIYRYTMEHNPTNLLAILDPGMRDLILSGAEGGFKAATAQRAYAKAVSGTAMLSVAMGIKSGAFGDHIKPGARPYEFQVGDTTVDTRAYSPFDKMFYLADLMHKTGSQGMDLTQALAEWTSAEVTDLALSQRRIGDIPVFAVEKFLQDAVSGDPERAAKRWKDTAGEFIGRFATPMKNAKLFTDVIWPEDQIARDQNNQALVGPTLSRLPHIGPETLPYKVDPTIGTPAPVSNPTLGPVLSIFGVRIEKVPALTQELKSINYPIYKMVGNNGDERLDRAVAENMGKMLQMEVPVDTQDGKAINKSVGNVIVEDVLGAIAKAYNVKGVQDPVLINSAKREILDEHFGKLRAQALAQAYARPEFSELFLQAKIRNFDELTSSQKSALLDELERIGVFKQLRTDANQKTTTTQTNSQPKK